jgi:N-glycosylase/DNA lyase
VECGWVWEGVGSIQYGSSNHGEGGVKLKLLLYMFDMAVMSTLSDVQSYLDEHSGSRTIREQKLKEQGLMHDILDIHSKLDMIQSVLKQQEQVVRNLIEDMKASRVANLDLRTNLYWM